MTLKTTDKTADEHHMRHALLLAGRGLGQVWPNPAVGCVIVKNNRIVGRGWTGQGGRPHAETEALKQAGKKARGSSVFVTLEPCHHTGKTPPCSMALIKAGVERVVVATKDPDPRVSGQGMDDLKDAGITVDYGLLQQQATDLNQGFLSKVILQRPLFALKTATTLDGRIATKTGDSHWITGPGARAFGHRLRSIHDAILIGRKTLEQDRPLLTCRLPGLENRSPLRIVLDSRLSVDIHHPIMQTVDDHPLIIITGKPESCKKANRLKSLGVQVITAKTNATGLIDVNDAAKKMAETGLTRVLIEGGGKVAASFLSANLIDRVYWFRAAKIIGGDGLPALAGMGVETMENVFSMERLETRPVGADILETFRIRSPDPI